MAPFASAVRHHRLEFALSAVTALFVSFSGRTTLAASERVLLAPDLS
jgi:hypothetical protein